MSILDTATARDTAAAGDSVARASIAFGRKRGYYRLLFENGPVDAATFATLAGVPEHFGRAWLEEQRAAGLLRLVAAPNGRVDEYLLPGEFVPLLLGDRGQPELAGARALLSARRAEVPAVLAANPANPATPANPANSRERAGHPTNSDDSTDALWSEHPSAF
jgi:hypothetical protein